MTIMIRRTKRLFLSVFLVFFFLPLAIAADVDVSGTWSSDLVGEIILSQHGNRVTGTYQYTSDEGIAKDGEISGVLEGRTIHATWSEHPSGGGRPQGRIGEDTQGDLEWEVSDDGKTLSGWYREAGDRDPGEEEKQEWNLER